MDSELIFAGDLPPATINGKVRRGDLRRLATGLYSRDVDTPPERLVQRHWPSIAGRLFPDAVISDRSSINGGPVGGVLYLVHDRRDRTRQLPGLTVNARRGPGPIPGDAALPGGLFQASRSRAIAENSRDSRARSAAVARTLTEGELADWIDDIRTKDGAERLQRYRIDAERLGPAVGASPRKLARVSELIGAALGTRQVALARGRCWPGRRAGRTTGIGASGSTSWWQRCWRLPRRTARKMSAIQRRTDFCRSSRRTSPTTSRAPSSPSRRHAAPSFDGELPYDRAADGHDLLGTYQLVSDDQEMSRLAQNPDEVIDLLRYRNNTIMAGRPEEHPGRFKEVANRPGTTEFVQPDLVLGTLGEGFRRIAALDTAWQRAVYTAFLVAEVHPSTTGTGAPLAS